MDNLAKLNKILLFVEDLFDKYLLNMLRLSMLNRFGELKSNSDKAYPDVK
jgi:hypothetical protein